MGGSMNTFKQIAYFVGALMVLCGVIIPPSVPWGMFLIRSIGRLYGKFLNSYFDWCDKVQGR